METRIAFYNDEPISEVASVVAAAMLNNPLHLAVFKSDDERSLRLQTGMFTKVLGTSSCNLILAKHNNQIVGVMNYYLPGKCQISPLKTMAMLPGLVSTLGPKLPAVLRWKTLWTRHDPKATHLHFGPLAVLPNLQNRGIGSSLLYQFCRIADAQKADAYLETDKEENLHLYKKFGFQVIKTDIVCGVKNWFMWREAQK